MTISNIIKLEFWLENHKPTGKKEKRAKQIFRGFKMSKKHLDRIVRKK